MKIQYLTNILDPILKVDQPFKKKIRTLLVSEKYSSSFQNGKYASTEFDFVLSDNGNFTRLNAIAKKYLPQATALEKIALEDITKTNKLSPATIKARKQLNTNIIKACKDEFALFDYTKITSKQIAINPHAIIGAEDTTIPILQICGAFKAIYQKCLPNLLPFQKNTVELYKKQKNGTYGSLEYLKEINKYIVVHGYDYKSIAKALVNIKKTKPEGIAISLGGPLACKGSLKNILIGNKNITFTEPHPESYVLCILYLLAVRDNTTTDMPIHILGLGSPILILLSAYIFKDFKFVTIDSTATSKDAEVNIIYGNKEGLLKMNSFKLAAYNIVYNKRFKGISPYYNSFEKKYPSNWANLKKEFDIVLKNKLIKKPEQVSIIRKALEANPKLLKTTVPFFLPIRLADKQLKQELRIARCFENYWVNVKLCNQVNEITSKAKFKTHTVNEVNKFAQYASADYVKAINELINIIDL